MKTRGYTLLEVLVATAIFSMVAVSVLSALSTSTRNTARITERDRAMLLARQKMDELLADRAVPRDVPLEGVFDPSVTGRFAGGWRAEVSTFEAGVKSEGAAALERVQVEVWWGPQGGQHTFRLVAYRRGALTPAEAAALNHAGAR